MSSATRIGLSIKPLDVLFFRDGRPFDAASRVTSGLPSPQALAGFVRTHLLQQAGCDFRKLGRVIKEMPIAEAFMQTCGAGWIADVRVRGPWLARQTEPKPVAPEVLIPVPANLHRIKSKGDSRDGGNDELIRLDPLSPGKSLPGWRPDDSRLRPLWTQFPDVTERVRGFFKPDGLKTYLVGGVPQESHVLKPDCLYAQDHRTGIGVHPDALTAGDGQIFARSFIALKDDVRFYAEIVPPNGDPAAEQLIRDAFEGSTLLPFGGESRHVEVTLYDKPFQWPEPKPANGKTCLLLTTPAVFDNGLHPRCLDAPAPLAGLANAGALPISGWDMARGGPKPTRFAVEAGSVYHLDENVDLPQHSLAEDEEEAQVNGVQDHLQGFGCYLRGVWNDG